MAMLEQTRKWLSMHTLRSVAARPWLVDDAHKNFESCLNQLGVEVGTPSLAIRNMGRETKLETPKMCKGFVFRVGPQIDSAQSWCLW